ncbi:mRNA-binding ribosome biosynthesis protein NOP4, partial [Aspergillus glaucus CBS 516.65]
EAKMEPQTNQEPATDGLVSRQPRQTLFVRSLPASATTDSLAEYFSQSYVIKHALVVLDPQTQQPKGFGFVTFADLEDAQRALEEFNGSVFEGKKITVDYAERRHREVDENIGKSVPSAAGIEFKKKREDERAAQQPPRLIVRNLPWSIKEPEDLIVHFRSFGKVKQAYLPKRGNVLAGFGFVVLRGKKNAEKALEAVNGKEVDGRTLAVDWAVEKNVWENLQKQDEEKSDEEEEKEKKKKKKQDDEEKSSDVDMAEAEEAASGDEDASEGDEDEDMEEDEEDDEEDELDEDNEDDIDEEEEDKEDERNASTIFIRNLPFTSTDESLYEHFTQFGNVRYARIVVDPETDRPRGTGFVCFWRPEDALTCIREGPKPQETIAADKDKSKKASAIKHSVLQNETSDPTGRYTLDGRVLQVAIAVSRNQATRLEEEGASRRLVRDTDKRRLFLLSEGTIPANSPLYKKLSPSEVKMREDSFKQRQSFIKKNPTLHLSLTRLSIRNIPRQVTSKDLKQLARQAVVGFAEEVKKNLRQPLSPEEQHRASDEMKEADKLRKQKGKGIVKQATIVFEGRDGTKIGENTGAGRSRGYGFIEYFTHRHALMGLRWLNGHPIDAPSSDAEVKDKKKRVIVEFAIENAQVVKRRTEQEAKSRIYAQTAAKKRKEEEEEKSQNPNGKKRSESRGSDKREGGENPEEGNKIAKRNRVIAKKRMQRKGRKGN